MATLQTVQTLYGEARELYIRLNNVEVSNHGVTSWAKFRGFASEEAFQNGGKYLWEEDIEFTADVSEPIWPQAYAALIAGKGWPAAPEV